MSSCSLVIVHASLKNMVSRKTRLKFLVPKTEVEHDVTKKFMTSTIFRIPTCNVTCVFLNRIMMKKKYRFFYPFTGEAPLKVTFLRPRSLILTMVEASSFASKGTTLRRKKRCILSSGPFRRKKYIVQRIAGLIRSLKPTEFDLTAL